jgi:class 3 adenylate cyclase
MIGNQAFFDGFIKYARSAASPAAAHALAVMNDQIDIRDILSSVAVPTLIVHRTGDRSTPIEGARYMAERIPGAKLVELDGEDHLPWTEDSESVLTETEEFVTGTRPEREITRVLSTVLFTDIVDSTVLAIGMGDEAWRRLLDRHDAICAKQVEHHRGRLIKTTGDGVLATFDGPARAIRCGQAIALKVRDLGIEIRAGLHTGEIELRDDDIGGVAVHFASRVIGYAEANQVVVSRTVKDLVAGSGLEFDSIGEQSLKGIPDTWELFSVRV